MENHVGNSYVISRCGINHNVVENILLTITQCGTADKKAVTKIVQSKAFLTQLRTLAMHVNVYQIELPVAVHEGLVKILSTLSDSEQDRKLLRTAFHILAKDGTYSQESFLNLLLEVVSAIKQSSAKAIVSARILGEVACRRSDQSSPKWIKATSALQKFSYLLINAKVSKKDPVYGLVAASFAGLRHLQANFSIDTQQVLTQAMQSIDLNLQRHILALLVTTVQTCTVESRGQWLSWYQLIISQSSTNAILLKDALTSTYAVRAAFAFVEIYEDVGGSKWPQEVITLVITALNLIQTAQLKYFIEYISCFITYGWRILPQMETKQKGIVSFLCGCLASVVKKATIDDFYLPTLLRSCEVIGRFLQQRPSFDVHHSHAAFSPHMVEIDGEALKALWIALRRQYRAATAPKAHSSALPNVIKAIPAQQQQQLLTANMDMTQLAPDSNNTIKLANAIPSPYFFSCLMRTLIWLAPDLRYCRKEHPLLWRLFSDDLVSSWEVISSAAAEHQLGDPMALITELFIQLFARIQLSTMAIEDNNEDSSSSSDINSIFDNTSSSNDVVSKCKLIFEPIYIDLLCKLSIMTLKQVTSPVAVTLFPQIYTAFYAFAFHTGIKENAKYVLEKLLTLLLEVMKVGSEAQSSKNVFKRQLYTGLIVDAVYILVPTMAVACKVYYTMNLTNASIGDPFTAALTEINFDNLLHQLRVESITSSEPGKRLSIHLARLIIALSEVFTNGSIKVTSQVSQLQRKLAHEIRVLLVVEDVQASIGLEDVVNVFPIYSFEHTIMSQAAKVVSSFSSTLSHSTSVTAVTTSIQVLGMYNTKFMAFEDIIQTVVFDDELAFDASINATADITEKSQPGEAFNNDVFNASFMSTVTTAAAAPILPQIDIIPIDLDQKKKDRRPLSLSTTQAVSEPSKTDLFGDDLFGGFEVLQPPSKQINTATEVDPTDVVKVNDGFGSSGFDSFDTFSAPNNDALKVHEKIAVQPSAQPVADFGVFDSRSVNSTSAISAAPAMNAVIDDPLEIFGKPIVSDTAQSANKGTVKTNPFKELASPPATAVKLVALPPPAAVGAAAKRGKAGKAVPPAKDFLADLLSSPPATSTIAVGNLNKAPSPAFDDWGATPVNKVGSSGFGQAANFGGNLDPFNSNTAAFQSQGFGPATTGDPFGGFPQQSIGQALMSNAWPVTKSTASDGFTPISPTALNTFYAQSAPSFGQTAGFAPPQMFPGASFAAMPSPQAQQYQQQQSQQLPPKPAPPKNPFDDFN